MAKKSLTSECPYCGLTMQTAVMHCPACQVRVEGVFAESVLNRLSPEDQQFLLEYLLSNFSIKALEENSSFGYAAIRSRLDKLIASTKSLMQAEELKKAILEKLRTGEITVAEAKRRLENL